MIARQASPVHRTFIDDALNWWRVHAGYGVLRELGLTSFTLSGSDRWINTADVGLRDTIAKRPIALSASSLTALGQH